MTQQHLLNFVYNSTGWNADTDSPVAGGQNEAMTVSTFQRLEELGIEYTITRQPRYGAVNCFYSTRDRYLPEALAAGVSHRAVLWSHGVADKMYYRGRKTGEFDYVMLPGDGVLHTATSYQKLPKGKSLLRGISKLDPLFWDRDLHPEQWLPSGDGRIRVLYAPTHGGSSERYRQGNRSAPGARATSYWYREEIVSFLESFPEFDVVESYHPRHATGGKATLWEYKEADVVVVDGGSTIYEAMSLGKPVLVPEWLTAERNLERGAGGTTLEAMFYAGGYGHHVQSMEDFPQSIREAHHKGQSERDADFAEWCVPSYTRGRSGEISSEFLRRLVCDEDVSTMLR